MSKSLATIAKSRGLRNNNPGNLILTNIAWQGKIPNKQNTDGHFEQFKDVYFGIRAMLLDVINDIKKGKNTVRKLITEYAPPHENNTEAYIAHVAKSLKISADTKFQAINGAFLFQLAKAIITKENIASEHKLITDEDIKKGIALVGERTITFTDSEGTHTIPVTVKDVKNISVTLLGISLILFFLHFTGIINLKKLFKWKR